MTSILNYDSLYTLSEITVRQGSAKKIYCKVYNENEIDLIDVSGASGTLSYFLYGNDEAVDSIAGTPYLVGMLFDLDDSKTEILCGKYIMKISIIPSGGNDAILACASLIVFPNNRYGGV